MTNTARTWEITDLDGSNRRTVTLAQYRAEIDRALALAAPIAAAWKRGDMAGVKTAQAAMREAMS